MVLRKWITAVIILGLAAGIGFANGVQDADTVSGTTADSDALETLTGVFDIEDGRYPVLETTAGERYYLLVRFPVAQEDIPEIGAYITIEAYQSRMSPVHLMVVSAEVDGKSIEPDWDSSRKGRRRRGHKRGWDDDDWDDHRKDGYKRDWDDDWDDDSD